MARFALFPCRAALVGSLFAVGSSLVVAQHHSSAPVGQKPGSEVGVIQTTVRRVILDVVVTGSDGEPARGLTQADFKVTEDDKPQTIRTFDVHDFDSGPEFVPPRVPPLGANTYLNLPKTPEKGPLYVFLYDMVNIDMDEQPAARAQLLKFIEDKPEGARFAIITQADGMNLVQGFTSDKDVLLATFDPKTSKTHVPQIFMNGGNYGRGSCTTTLSVFEELGHYLEGFPGRKNVIWLTGSFPSFLFAEDCAEDPVDAKEVVDTLARDQVAIYPIDVRGVNIMEQGTAVWKTHANADFLARVTGGRAYYGTNDVAGLLKQATANGANYYTLSYSPTNYTYDGKERKIHVELAKKGYTLAYRRSYFGLDPDAKPATDVPPAVEMAGARGSIPQDDPLSTEMRHGAPMAHDLIFRVQFQAVGAPMMATPEQMSMLVDDAGALRRQMKNKPVKVEKPIPLQSYAVDYRVVVPRTGGAPPTLEFVAAAFDADGNMLSGVLQHASHDAVAGKAGASRDNVNRDNVNQENIFRVRQQLAVPLRAAWMRVAVRDLLTDRVGTLEIPLPLAQGASDAAAAQVPGVRGEAAAKAKGVAPQGATQQ